MDSSDEELGNLNKILEAEKQYSLQRDLDDFLNIDESDNDSVFGEEEEERLVRNEIERDFQNNCQSLENLDVNFLVENKISLKDLEHRNITFLSQDEHEIINKCDNLHIKKLMLLNRAKLSQLKDVYNNLLKLLQTCNQEIREEATTKPQKKYRYFMRNVAFPKLRMPYFKTSQNLTAPYNSDVKIKTENQEYFHKYADKFASYWTKEEHIILKRAVMLNYVNYRAADLQLQMRSLKAKNNVCGSDEDKVKIQAEIMKLEKELEKLFSPNGCEPPPLGCNTGIDWDTIAEVDLKERHSANECRAFWNIYLHPLINKSEWSNEENDALFTLAAEQQCQDWDTIARRLNSNRTGFISCVHYFSNLTSKFRSERFTPEEDEYLIEVVSSCQRGDFIPWMKVAYYFQDRSKTQLYYRYKYHLQQQGVRKGTFTIAEDVLLMCLVHRFGKEFSLFTQHIPTRTPIQLRSRYVTYLQNLELNMGNYTLEDDMKILKYVSQHGIKKWVGLCNVLKRTRTHIRHRYLTIQQWVEKNPGKDISELPRRKNFCIKKRQNHLKVIGNLFKSLRCQKILPTLAMVEEHVELELQEKRGRPGRAGGSRNQYSVVDMQLIDYFKASTYQLGKTTTGFLSTVYLKQHADGVKKILDLLSVNLKIPSDEELKANSKLCNNDREILSYLRQPQLAQPIFTTQPSTSQSNPVLEVPQEVQGLIPPNTNTLVGLRSLIVKFRLYNERLLCSLYRSSTVHDVDVSNTTLYDKILWKIERNISKKDEATQLQILKERELFAQRFYSLFKWPSIMSLQQPTFTVEEEESGASNSASSEVVAATTKQPARRRGRPKKMSYPKVEKMIKARKRNIVAEKEVVLAPIAVGNIEHLVNAIAESRHDAREEPKKRKQLAGINDFATYLSESEAGIVPVKNAKCVKATPPPILQPSSEPKIKKTRNRTTYPKLQKREGLRERKEQNWAELLKNKNLKESSTRLRRKRCNIQVEKTLEVSTSLPPNNEDSNLELEKLDGLLRREGNPDLRSIKSESDCGGTEITDEDDDPNMFLSELEDETDDDVDSDEEHNSKEDDDACLENDNFGFESIQDWVKIAENQKRNERNHGRLKMEIEIEDEDSDELQRDIDILDGILLREKD